MGAQRFPNGGILPENLFYLQLIEQLLVFRVFGPLRETVLSTYNSRAAS